MISDLHLHTRLSRDATQIPENDVHGYVNTAVQKNLKYIAITEHKDIYEENAINADLEECAKLVNEEKNRIAENSLPVTLIHGVELAHAHEMPAEATKVIASHSYDFILGSFHRLIDKSDFSRFVYSEIPEDELIIDFERYLENIYQVAVVADFDSFAHCTYPLRYYLRNNKLVELCKEPSKYVPKNAPHYEDIFKTLIQRGKALEINTSGIKFGEVTLPTYDLMKLYRKLGGELVTIGSDSHDTKHLGTGVDLAEEMLKELGFPGVTVFIKRKEKVISF